MDWMDGWINRRIRKICDAFAARRYPVPDLDGSAKYVCIDRWMGWIDGR